MQDIITIAVAVIAVIVLIKILSAPIKLIFKLLLNAALGFLLLFVFNTIASLFGFSVNITWISCLVAGVLGIPGVLILVLLEILF